MSAATSLFLFIGLAVGLGIIVKKLDIVQSGATAGADVQQFLTGNRNAIGDFQKCLNEGGDFFTCLTGGNKNQTNTPDERTPEVKPLAELGNKIAQNIVANPIDGVKKVPLPSGIKFTDNPAKGEVSFPSNANVVAFTDGIIVSNKPPITKLTDAEIALIRGKDIIANRGRGNRHG